MLPHTSVRVYPPGLGECLKSYIYNHNVVCLLLCRPTDTASQLRPLPAATKTSSADLFVDAEPAGGEKNEALEREVNVAREKPSERASEREAGFTYVCLAA